MINDFVSYEWGYITYDGTRQAAGPNGIVKADQVAGVWCIVNRVPLCGYKSKGDNPDTEPTAFYHEVFLEEYKTDKGSWARRPITQLLKLAQRQAYNRAFVDVTMELDQHREHEIGELPNMDVVITVKKLWLWHCDECNHEFYTPLEDVKTPLMALLLKLFKKELVECKVCNEVAAHKVKIVTKRVQA